jgi:hypothetical protein
MKVLDILLEAEPVISSSEELAKAFTPGQWYNIVAHFNSRGGKPISRSTFFQINKEIGGEMVRVLSTAEWNAKASLYKMNAPQEFATWQDIYNYLKPFGDKKAAAPADDDSKPRPLAMPTKESFAEFQTWATGPEAFTDRTTLRSYIVTLSDAITKKRSERDSNWNTFVNSPEYTTTSNRYIEDFKKMTKGLLDKMTGGTSITKKEVDNNMYAWLNTIDQAISQTKFK